MRSSVPSTRGDSAYGSDSDKFVQSLLFARYPAATTLSPENTAAQASGKKMADTDFMLSPSYLNEDRVEPLPFAPSSSADKRGGISRPNAAMLSPERGLARPKTRVPPRKSVLDNRNAVLGGSNNDFSKSLKSPDALPPSKSTFSDMHFDGQNVDARTTGMSSFKMDISATNALSQATYSEGSGALRKSSPLANSEYDDIDLYGNGRNPLSMHEVVWQRWVVVFGYSSEGHSAEKILHEFQSCGDIDSYVVGDGNWIFIRFLSPQDAQRAERLNGSCLAGTNNMLGVVRLCAGDSSKNFRALLQKSMGGPRDILGEPRSANRLGQVSEADGMEAPNGSEGLRQRREALSSVAYR